MTQPFPAPMKFGQDEPLRFEGEIVDLELVEGEIPADLAGLYTQAVPDFLYPPITDTLYPMDLGAGGDGMIRAFRFADGKVDFATKYVKTERFEAQRTAKKGLFGQYRNPFTDAPEASGVDRTTANTMINYHAGVLLCAKEDGRSYAVDPQTLETIGPWTANGAITSQTLTAHPKFDPSTGEMFTFGYFADGVGTTAIRYYVVDASGKVTHDACFDAPEPWMIHDCGVTENYFIIPLMQYSTDVDRIKKGGPFYIHEPEREMIVGVIPRYGNADEVRWFRGPKCVLTHTINTFEEDGKIKFDVLRYDGNAFGFIIPDKDGNGEPFGSTPTSFVRWTIDPKADSLEITECENFGVARGEGAHIDDRWSSKKHRYMWLPELRAEDAPGGRGENSKRAQGPQLKPGEFPGAIPAAGMPPMAPPGGDDADMAMAPPGNEHGNSPTMFNSIRFFDLEKGTQAIWFAGESTNLQDPIFCPRSESASEGDGYIVVLRNRHGVRGAQLVILDAMDVEAGPIGVVNVPVPIRLGIHTTWLPAYRMA